MPAFSEYPNEKPKDFAQRMKGKGGMQRAAGRFLQTAAQKDAKKGIIRNY